MTFTYPLPQDTKQKFFHRNEQCDNLSLLLDRYIGYKLDQRSWQFQEEQKAELFRKIARQFQFPADLIQAHYRRWQQLAQFLEAQTFTARPEWRMVVGLGQTSVLETSMTVDRITGIPIIPGSALKGLAASYAMLCDLEEPDRAKAEKNNLEFKAIFGSQGESGKVIFLDAVPTEAPKLEPDIMNNHYQEYYSDKTGRTSPTPYQNPVLVYFLTLGKKSRFAFAVGSRDQQPDTKKLVEQAEHWLRGGLSELGIGAKTSAGYGYMS